MTRALITGASFAVAIGAMTYLVSSFGKHNLVISAAVGAVFGVVIALGVRKRLQRNGRG